MVSQKFFLLLLFPFPLFPELGNELSFFFSVCGWVGAVVAWKKGSVALIISRLRRSESFLEYLIWSLKYLTKSASSREIFLRRNNQSVIITFSPRETKKTYFSINCRISYLYSRPSIESLLFCYYSSGPSIGSFPSLSSSDERTNHFGTCQSRSDTSETDQRRTKRAERNQFPGPNGRRLRSSIYLIFLR